MKLERHIAEKANDWVRFEAEVKGSYAHDLTAKLIECKSAVEEKNLILSIFIEKYMLIYKNSRKLHKISRLMLKALEEKSYEFPKIETRISELERSIDYIMNNSGLFPILWKIEGIWNFEAVENFLEFLKEQYREKFLPNKDHVSWLNKHLEYYRKQGKPWKIK